MVNMNLLNDAFNSDNRDIVRVNKKYLYILVFMILIISLLLLVKKNNYYVNTFSASDGTIVLLAEKEYVNKVKENKEIIINEIKCDYSIKEIIPADDSFFISINLNTKIKNIGSGIYKVNLGKERLFDYIIRIIKK